MLLAIVIWVSATRCVDRAAASSTLSPSSAIQRSSQTSGGSALRTARAWGTKRATKIGVSGGGRVTKSLSAAASAPIPSSLAATSRAVH